MYTFVPNYTRIRTHKHVPQMSSLGVHGTGGVLRELVPKMEAALPLCMATDSLWRSLAIAYFNINYTYICTQFYIIVHLYIYS